MRKSKFQTPNPATTENSVQVRTYKWPLQRKKEKVLVHGEIKTTTTEVEGFDYQAKGTQVVELLVRHLHQPTVNFHIDTAVTLGWQDRSLT